MSWRLATGRMSLEGRVFVGIVRVAEALTRHMGEALEPYRITLGQYGVLESLHRAGTDGLACGEIALKLVTRDPDVTRLVDRLEDRGLVVRVRARPDRRVVRTQLTPAGVRLAEELEVLMRGLHLDYLRGVGKRDLGTLEGLLGAAEAAVQATTRRHAPVSP